MGYTRMPSQVGLRFGNFVVLEEIREDARLKVRVQCDCGNIETRRHGNISKGRKSMCYVCVRKLRAKTGDRTRTHGLSKTSLYGVHKQMMRRCYVKRCKDYKNWGQRGIIVCDEWHDVKNFILWANLSGYRKGLTIERENVNGNYEALNCAWIPNEHQARNRTNTRR